MDRGSREPAGQLLEEEGEARGGEPEILCPIEEQSTLIRGEHGRRSQRGEEGSGRPQASLGREAQRIPRREALLTRAGREAFIREDAGSPASISA